MTHWSAAFAISLRKVSGWQGHRRFVLPSSGTTIKTAQNNVTAQRRAALRRWGQTIPMWPRASTTWRCFIQARESIPRLSLCTNARSRYVRKRWGQTIPTQGWCDPIWNELRNRDTADA